MTRNDYDDKSLSVFFAVIGILGIVPAIGALFFVAYMCLSAVMGLLFLFVLLLEYPIFTLGILAGTFTVLAALISVIFLGFWLLPQYIRRASGKVAYVPPKTLWRLSTLQNALCALGALGLFLSFEPGTYSNGGWEGVLCGPLPVLWFSCLTALAASGIPDDDE